MDWITLITTGGTIDKTYGQGKGIRDLHIGLPIAPAVFDRMKHGTAHFQVRELMRKDSLDLTDEDRKEILRVCNVTTTLKILITHGTDTMKETAEVLSKAVDVRCTIVLTGASIPAAMLGSDAELNLGLALGACLFAPPGIYIAMNGVHLWNACTKNPTTGIFEPI
jgi:L-asparaginase